MNEWMQRLNALIGPQAGVIKNLAAPIFIVMVLAMMVLPIPPLLLDMFFTTNIALALRLEPRSAEQPELQRKLEQLRRELQRK